MGNIYIICWSIFTKIIGNLTNNKKVDRLKKLYTYMTKWQDFVQPSRTVLDCTFKAFNSSFHAMLPNMSYH
jgi:hypothetical protein